MGAREETLRISIFFFLLFTPFSSYMTILTHIYETAHLSAIGPATLSCNYVAFIISTFVAPILRIGLKKQLVIAGIAYSINYTSGIFVSLVDQSFYKYLISCLGAVIAGSSGGLLWVSQGRYIHLVCEKYGALKRKGEMFGIFSTVYCLSNVTAGLITTFALGFFDELTYFSIISLLGAISILFCLLFVKDIKEGDRAEGIDVNLIVDKASTVSQLTQSQQSVSIQIEQKYSIKEALKKVLHYFPVMYSVIPILIIDGMCLGVYSSQITHLIPHDVPKDMVNKYAGYSMISLGFGSTIGGFLCGKFIDHWGTVISGRIGVFLFLIGCGLYITALQIQLFAVTLIAAFVWGFFLFYIEGWMYAVCSRHFQGKAEAFSVNKQLHSIFYLLFQLVLIYTSNQIPLLSMIGWIIIFAIPAIILIDKIPKVVK